VSEHLDAAGARFEQSDCQVQERGLARPVRPDEADDLAGGDRQGALGATRRP
jgi:hypothetical protein